MPIAVARKCFDDVRRSRVAPDSGEAEDTIFFHKHLDIHAEENKRHKFTLARRPMMDVIEKNLYCIIVGLKLPTSLPPRRRLLDLWSHF